jgi:hypothetical protein
MALAQIIRIPSDEAYASAHKILNKLIAQYRTCGILTEEQSSMLAGLQEWLFECASHASKSGTCICAHHRLAYRIGDISESYYYKDIDKMLPFLIQTRTILKRLIAKNARKAVNRPNQKAGIAKAQ